MSFLQKAIELAEQGFYVFPLQPGSKIPAIDDFPNRATKDIEQIKKFWIDPVLELEQPYNIGISTTRYNGSQALVVVDVDNKGKKKGSDEVLKLELEGFDFIETITQKTPTGGRHLIYRTKTAVKQGTDVLAKGLDIRSKGGYIVAPGSVIEGKVYEIESQVPVAECPQWIVDKCGRGLEKESVAATTEINSNIASKRALYYLEKEAPLSEEGNAGDQTAFKVAAKLKDLGICETDAMTLMLEHWNDRCQPPWNGPELLTKIKNAYKYGARDLGIDSPEAQFTPVDEITESNYLQEMNKHYAIVFNEGDYAILFETVTERGHPKREFLSEYAFRRKFSPDLVQQGKGAAKSFADIWLDWKGRRQYNGVCFKPELEANNNYYNLWRGFTRKPVAYADASPSARLGFDLFVDHAKANVCEGNEKLFIWLMGYFAHMIQRPWERPSTTLVFKGRKGVGKNVLIDRIGKLLGNGHYLVAQDGRYLTSNFNGHLDSCLCLVLDEAFWSGDKKAEGKLKGITTETQIMIERKGKEPYMVDNLVRLVVIGNEDWLVPASYDERRYAVYEVGEGKKQNREYFQKLVTLMDNKGGAEVLMHYLKNFDLKLSDVHVAPMTKGLQNQKLESLPIFEQYWYQCLVDGRIVNSDFASDWQLEISKNEFRRAYISYCKERNVKSWVLSDIALGRLLKKMTPSIDGRQKTIGSQDNAYRFKDLKTVRHEWDMFMSSETYWDSLE